MHLDKIHIINYRNVEDERIQFHNHFNIISGNNGMGKTNILDSIYYLALTKSYFINLSRDFMRFGSDFMRIQGDFADQSQFQVVAKVDREKKKTMERDGNIYDKLSDHVGLIPIVMIAPKDQDLIYDGSSGRRNFIDNTISQIDQKYLNQLLHYNYHLKQRNAYLKNLERPHHLDQALIHIYNDKLVKHASYIVEKRKEVIQELSDYFQKAYQEISGGTEIAGIQYKTKLLEKDFEDILLSNQEKDCILGRTTSGIHRDDLVFEINEKSLRNIGSQGQQKSFILALKIAQYDVLSHHVKSTPIVLLDDIFDKLDHTRVRRLIQLLNDRSFGQVFITDTEQNRLGNIFDQLGIHSYYFHVKEGKVLTQKEKVE